jgi:hypothetical protein
MHSELSEDVLVVQIRGFLIERRRNGIFSWPLSYLLHATVAYGHSLTNRYATDRRFRANFCDRVKLLDYSSLRIMRPMLNGLFPAQTAPILNSVDTE